MNKLNYDQYQLLKTIYNHLKEITKTTKQKEWGTKTLITQNFNVGYFKYKHDDEKVIMSNYIKWISEKISNEKLLKELQDGWYIRYEYVRNDHEITDQAKITMHNMWYQAVRNIWSLEIVELFLEKYKIFLGSIIWWIIGSSLIEFLKKILS